MIKTIIAAYAVVFLFGGVALANGPQFPSTTSNFGSLGISAGNGASGSFVGSGSFGSSSSQGNGSASGMDQSYANFSGGNTAYGTANKTGTTNFGNAQTGNETSSKSTGSGITSNFGGGVALGIQYGQAGFANSKFSSFSSFKPMGNYNNFGE